jgi:4-hydroxybutyrate dehydrogenase
MMQFAVRPTVLVCDTFAEFVETTEFGPKDCIFTVSFLNDTWIKPLGVQSHVLLFENYGAGEPTDDMIDAIFADFRKLDVDRVIAIGGGSVIDIAKLMALKPTGSAFQFFEKSVDLIKEKELILVPTTCGTGSEVTNISIAGIPSKNTKMGLAIEQLFADKAVLVPELIYGLPEFVFVTSSLDALVHALESYMAPRSHDFCDVFSRSAVRKIVRAYKYFLENGRKAAIPAIAKQVLIASSFAGVAFANTGVGAVHALSYPLGGVYHVPHGEANARFLTAVCKVYREKKPEGRIKNLTNLLQDVLEVPADQDPWLALENMVNELLPPKALREYGMSEHEIEDFADNVIEKQQRLLVNNYVELSRDEIRDIFKYMY